MKTQKRQQQTLQNFKKGSKVKSLNQKQLHKIQGGMPYELEGSSIIIEDDIGGFIITEELDGF